MFVNLATPLRRYTRKKIKGELKFMMVSWLLFEVAGCNGLIKRPVKLKIDYKFFSTSLSHILKQGKS